MLQIQPCAERPDVSPARQKFCEKPIVGLIDPIDFVFIWLHTLWGRMEWWHVFSFPAHHTRSTTFQQSEWVENVKNKNWLWHEKERHKCFILVLKLTLTRCLDAIEHAIETKADEERRVKEACAVAWGCDHLQLQLGSMSQLESYITAAWEISFLVQIWVWNWATWWFKVLQAFPVFHL